MVPRRTDGRRADSGRTDNGKRPPPQPTRTTAGSVVGLVGSVQSMGIGALLSYGVALLVCLYGLAGISSGYWLGGDSTIYSTVCLTPHFRRWIGSSVGSPLTFVVLFAIGRSSPTAWLF
ncbi:hypothetical protein GCM10028856_34300 [Halopiger thermotolerans]